MKKRKLKAYVLPTVYFIALAIMAFSITFLSQNLLDEQKENDEHYNYSMSVFDETKDEEVNQEVENSNSNDTFVPHPFTSDLVEVAKDFYEKDGEEETQKNALIFYENTYMPNTGILYQANDPFDVIAVMDGKVKEITTDEILGNVLTIENSSKLTTIYYTLGEIKVKSGDTVKMGDIIATSGETKLETDKPQTLLFETYKDGVLVNPNIIFETKISELN